MNTLRSFARAALITGVVAGGMQSHAAAHPDTTQNAPATHHIHVRNVRPGIIAWWLDPAHQTEPIEFTMGRWASGFSHEGKTKAPEPANALKLPEGVTSIEPVDAQNTLIVRGTPEGFLQLEETVKRLDQPIRQIEIIMQVVEISPEDAKSLDIEFLPADANATNFVLGRVRGDIQSRLDELVQQKKAKIVNAPRVTTMNNLATSLGHSTGAPAVLGIKDEAGEFKALYEPPVLDPKEVTSVPRVLMTTQAQFVVTPTINNDNTITLLLEPSKTLWMTKWTVQEAAMQEPLTFGENSLFLKTLDRGTAAVNLANKETIALTGSTVNAFSSNNFSIDTAGQNKTSNVIVLLTANIHRRAEDLAALPPTM